MGITKFLYLLLAFSIAIIFYDIDQVTNEQGGGQKPLVSFYDSIMYTIDTENVKHIIPSEEAYFYKKNKEEMFNGTIMTRSNDKKQTAEANTLRADSIVKIYNNVYLDGNVNLNTSDGMSLKTEQLQYNLQTKIAHNEERFYATQGFNDFYGKNLYYDGEKKYLQAKYTHFNIKVENNE